MKILLLSCSTGEGHNRCALAVQEALKKRGHTAEFLDMLQTFGGGNSPLSFEKLLNNVSQKTPARFGMIYHAGEMYSATNATSPVYLANIRHAAQLHDFILAHQYDAVVCSHLFPMETLTYLRRRAATLPRCYGVLSDYTCIPFLKETSLDRYFVPHADVARECQAAGIPAEKLEAAGMPVSAAFQAPMSRLEAREKLHLPADKKIYLIMTGGIGCGDAAALCAAIRKVPAPDTLLCVLTGRNDELRQSLQAAFPGNEQLLTVPFTDQVAVYMRAADVLLSKAGGISSSEAAILGAPLVHTMVIPGVETLNARFFAAHGMSLFAQNADEAARCADRLIYDTAMAFRMLAAQKACLPSNGAERIAQAIEAGA